MRPSGRSVNSSRTNTKKSTCLRVQHYFGDDPNIKTESCLRIGFQNPNGLPSINQAVKNDRLRHCIHNWQLDILCLAEINHHWAKVPFGQRLPQRTSEWYYSGKWSIGYNQKEKPKNLYQPGGTAVFVHDQMTGYSVQTGTDERRLGRWSWMRFRGRHGVMMRVVAAYCPHTAGGATSASISGKWGSFSILVAASERWSSRRLGSSSLPPTHCVVCATENSNVTLQRCEARNSWCFVCRKIG